MASREDIDFGEVRARKLTVAGELAGKITPPSFAVANMPSAGAIGCNGAIVKCTNGDAGDPCLAYSDGTDWLRIALGAAVAVA